MGVRLPDVPRRVDYLAGKRLTPGRGEDQWSAAMVMSAWVCLGRDEPDVGLDVQEVTRDRDVVDPRRRVDREEHVAGVGLDRCALVGAAQDARDDARGVAHEHVPGSECGGLAAERGVAVAVAAAVGPQRRLDERRPGRDRLVPASDGVALGLDVVGLAAGLVVGGVGAQRRVVTDLAR
jgi:hypothetical protein